MCREVVTRHYCGKCMVMTMVQRPEIELCSNVDRSRICPSLPLVEVWSEEECSTCRRYQNHLRTYAPRPPYQSTAAVQRPSDPSAYHRGSRATETTYCDPPERPEEMQYRGRERGDPASERPHEQSRYRHHDQRPSPQVSPVSFQSDQEDTITSPEQRDAHVTSPASESFERFRPEPPRGSEGHTQHEFDRHDLEEAVARSMADVRAKELRESQMSWSKVQLELAAQKEAIARSLADVSLAETRENFDKDRRIAALELEVQVGKEKVQKVASEKDRAIDDLRIALQAQQEEAEKRESRKDRDIVELKSLLQLESEKRDVERQRFEIEREAFRENDMGVQPPTEPEVTKIVEPTVRYRAPKGRELWILEVKREQGRLVERERRMGPNDMVFSRCKKP
ncbi:hypothetical protein EDD36DRAFT_196240 [Exophiala viscosa]|uniref:Uncharacterized protein n=1 Tax=Exophiala viscosa TaxID=2486360 RepID=A0AAN6E297_9EURO|nr:hypothetical protein EDD36DRAFT_196240 [Exophiala viscosa]